MNKPAAIAANALQSAMLRWLLALALLLALFAPASHAEGVELIQLSSSRSEEGLELSFSTRFELPHAAEDALLKGVPIYFTAEAVLLRGRWYWRDARVARATRTWRLAWQPLTRQYKISTGGLNQSYASLSEALSALRGVSEWRIAENRELEDGRHYIEFSFKLDTSQLPRPMQIGLGSPEGWGLSIERSLSLNSDFSSRPITP